MLIKGGENEEKKKKKPVDSFETSKILKKL